MSIKHFTILSAINTLSGNKIYEFDMLVNGGFDINSDLSGSRPIHEICRYGYSDFLLYLIQKGAELDVEDWNMRTPLQICIEYGRWECFKLLIEKGAKFGEEVSQWLQEYEFLTPEICAYVKKLLQKINWEKRKCLIFVYYYQKINLPFSIFRELTGFL